MADEQQPQVENIAETTAQETEQKAPEAKKMKFVVDGAETEVDEEIVKREYQKGLAGDKKLREAAELRKQVEAFVENVRSNPNALLEQLGHSPKEWARQLLLAEIEQEAQEADPNLRKIADLEKRLMKFEEASTKAEREAAEKRMAAEEAATIERIDSSIHQTLSELGFKQGEAPAEIVADIAEQMLMEYKLSQKALDPKEAFGRAKDSFSRRLQAMTMKKPEALLDLLPPDYLDKIAEAYITKRKPKDVPSVKTYTSANPDVKEDKTQKSIHEFFSRR